MIGSLNVFFPKRWADNSVGQVCQATDQLGAEYSSFIFYFGFQTLGVLLLILTFLLLQSL